MDHHTSERFGIPISPGDQKFAVEKVGIIMLILHRWSSHRVVL